MKDFKYAILMILDILIIFLGAFLIYASFNPNAETMNALGDLAIKHLKGMDSGNLGSYIVGLLSDGTVVNVPAWQFRIGMVVGFVMLYFGLISLYLHKKKKSLKTLLTRTYWTNFYTEMKDIK